MTVHKTSSELLRKKREEAGLTQSELGERAGMTQQRVHRFESGETRFRVEDILQFSEALKCEPNDLIPGARTLSDRERALLTIFSQLPPEEQDKFLRVGNALAEPPPEDNGGSTGQTPHRKVS